MRRPRDLIRTPDNAQYFAAIGAVEFGKSEEDCVGCYRGPDKLAWYIEHGRDEEKSQEDVGGGGLAANPKELEAFKERYRTQALRARDFPSRGEVVRGFIGLDGGSTSTKAVLVSADKERRVLFKTYELSKGNPIEDTIEILSKLEDQLTTQGAELEVLGVGTTGYAKDILKDVIGADAALVETVAHTEAGLHFYHDVDVICDVGGQDIKIIILKNGRVKDFKLNTQCSAGNGYFLQSTAQGFGYPVEKFADVAFSAESFPVIRLRLRGLHAVRHRGFPAPGMEAGRDHGGPVQRAAEEHLAVRIADSEPVRHRHAASSCRAARSTIWPRSSRRWTSSSRASAARRAGRRSSCTSTAVRRAPSARRSKPGGCGTTAARLPSSAWRRFAKSATKPPAPRRRAATSARTTACARSSM